VKSEKVNKENLPIQDKAIAVSLSLHSPPSKQRRLENKKDRYTLKKGSSQKKREGEMSKGYL